MVSPVTLIGDAVPAVIAVRPPSVDVHVAVYDVIGRPLLAGALNATCIKLVPGVIVGVAGLSGCPIGMTGADPADAGPVPTPFVAAAVHV